MWWRCTAVVLGVLLVAWLCLVLAAWLPTWNCLGPPFLYVTFHHDEKGVRKYTRDGCFISDNILEGRGKDRKIKEARDIQLGTYQNEEVLYVVQAMSKSSSVKIFGECNGMGKRKYLTTGPSIKSSMGLNHPYGMAFDSVGNLYVSCQHTNTVLRFEKDTFKPIPLPPRLKHIPLIDEKVAHTDVIPSLNTALFEGTFFQYEVLPEQRMQHKHHNKKSKQAGSENLMTTKEGVRGLTFVEEDLWVACEDTKGVSVVNPDGVETHRIKMGKGLRPVGVLYDKNHTGLVYVSTRGKSVGPVLAIDPLTRQVVKQYAIEGQKHTTGLLIHDDMLYVACQELGAIITFDLHTAQHIGIIASNFPDTIERMLLSDC